MAEAIEKNDRLCKLGNGDHDGNSNGNVIAQDIRKHLAAIEATLDAPMKPAVEWFCEINYDDWSKRQWEDFIRAIQADALASKLPEVDLRGLAEETAVLVWRCEESTPARSPEATENIIHAALLKVRGGV